MASEKSWVAAAGRPTKRWRQRGEVPIWVIIGLGLVGGLGLYWYTTPRAAPAWVRGWLPTAEPSGQNKPLYRWQDAYGREHVTDKPPVGRPYQVVISPLDANVLPSSPKRGEDQ